MILLITERLSVTTPMHYTASHPRHLHAPSPRCPHAHLPLPRCRARNRSATSTTSSVLARVQHPAVFAPELREFKPRYTPIFVDVDCPSRGVYRFSAENPELLLFDILTASARRGKMAMLMISTQILAAHQCYLFGRPVHGHWVPDPSSSIPINILSAHVLLLFDSFTYSMFMYLPLALIYLLSLHPAQGRASCLTGTPPVRLFTVPLSSLRCRDPHTEC